MKQALVLCEMCGKEVPEDSDFYSMDINGNMFAFCSEECYQAHNAEETNRSMRSLGGIGTFGMGGRGGFRHGF